MQRDLATIRDQAVRVISGLSTSGGADEMTFDADIARALVNAGVVPPLIAVARSENASTAATAKAALASILRHGGGGTATAATAPGMDPSRSSVAGPSECAPVPGQHAPAAEDVAASESAPTSSVEGREGWVGGEGHAGDASPAV